MYIHLNSSFDSKYYHIEKYFFSKLSRLKFSLKNLYSQYVSYHKVSVEQKHSKHDSILNLNNNHHQPDI